LEAILHPLAQQTFCQDLLFRVTVTPSKDCSPHVFLTKLVKLPPCVLSLVSFLSIFIRQTTNIYIQPCLIFSERVSLPMRFFLQKSFLNEISWTKLEVMPRWRL
jgi:hypothetical protein